MFMWTTIVNSLSQVADHPMSSPLEDATEEAIKKDTGYKRIFIFLRRGIVGKKKRVNCFLSLVLSILIQQFRAPPQNRAISHGCSCAECSTLLLLAVPIARS